jgi:hypothetical protein
MNARSARAPPFQQTAVSTRIGIPIHNTDSATPTLTAVTMRRNQKSPTAKLAIR